MDLILTKYKIFENCTLLINSNIGGIFMFVEMKDAVKKYGAGDNTVYALNGASLEVAEGEIGIILGHSGSGKSTMLNMIGGLDVLDSGTIIVADTDITKYSSKQLTDYRRKNIGFVFQFYNLIPDLTVAENIEVVTDISENPLEVSKVMQTLDIEKLSSRFPNELSGGQQQRVAIARALVKNPKLLLCDELTGALDSKSSKEVLSFIEKVNKEFNTTILIITHNEDIQSMADRIIRIHDGQIVMNDLNKNKTSVEMLEI